MFFGTASKLLFPDHFLPNCFRFPVLYTAYYGAYSSVLAVLHLDHFK